MRRPRNLVHDDQVEVVVVCRNFAGDGDEEWHLWRHFIALCCGGGSEAAHAWLLCVRRPPDSSIRFHFFMFFSLLLLFSFSLL